MTKCIAILALLLTLYVGTASAQEVRAVPGCGSLKNSYGPYDYRDPNARANKLPVVEDYHFTPEVESLQSGSTGYLAMGDIDYTLRAFPNHPRALAAMAKWALMGGVFPDPRIPSAECYFQRALTFAPDDPAVRLVYGSYLYKRHKLQDALQQYEMALKIAPQSPEINYDAGLLYLKLGDLTHAKQCANVAYGGGYPLPGLRMLIDAAESSAGATHRDSEAHAASTKP